MHSHNVSGKDDSEDPDWENAREDTSESLLNLMQEESGCSLHHNHGRRLLLQDVADVLLRLWTHMPLAAIDQSIVRVSDGIY
jgi:hypothetical protein